MNGWSYFGRVLLKGWRIAQMTKRRFNDIRARLLMRFKSHGSFAPKDENEKFVAEIIEAKHELDKRVEKYKEK